MKIASVSALSFKAQPETEQPKKTGNTVKDFVSDKKNRPYIAGGAAVTAAIVLGIIGVKRGWFKSTKKLEQKGQELIDEIKNPKPEPKAEPKIEAKEEVKIESPVTQNEKPAPKAEGSEVNPPVEKPVEGLHTEMSVVDDSELLTDNVAHVDVNDEYIEPEIIRQIKANKLKPVEKAAEEIETPITPMGRIKTFLSNVDKKAEAQISSLNERYPIINNINSGYRRYKKDITEAFDKIISDPQSGYKGTYKVIGNTIHEFRPDGSKVMYIFDKGAEGGLRFIREVPANGGKPALSFEFAPELYWDLGKGIGIHRLIGIEYKNPSTNRVLERITIDPKKRSFHNIEIFHPETGKPVLTAERTAEPDNLYYLAKLYDTETGEMISRVNTKTDFGIAKVSETSPKVAKIK